MSHKIEVFYTGGGITIAETDIDSSHYAVVSTEAPDFFTVYSFSRGEKTYLPDDMVYSIDTEKVHPDLKPIYDEMLSKLKSV